MENGNRCKRAGLKIKISILALLFLLNLIVWSSRSVCDWYVKYIYPIAVNIWGRILSAIPFSVGEWMLVAAILIAVTGVVLLILSPFFKGKIWRLCKIWWNGISWFALWVMLVLTLHLFVLYHSTGFAEQYMGESGASGSSGIMQTGHQSAGSETIHTEEELYTLYCIVTEKCNELCTRFDRDENDYLLYNGNLEEEAKKAMKHLGETYPRLAGYYPTAKKIWFSGFFSQQYLTGIFLPYSMEANYNQVMYIVNKPFTLCHELSHIKGFIYEEEANFIAYLACIQSEDPLFQYSGYLGVYSYIVNDIYANYDLGSELWQNAVRIDALAAKDDIFLTEESWEEVENKAVFETEDVREVSNKVNDTSLKLNGVEEGVASYSRVVELLLDYYDIRVKSP